MPKYRRQESILSMTMHPMFATFSILSSAAPLEFERRGKHKRRHRKRIEPTTSFLSSFMLFMLKELLLANSRIHLICFCLVAVRFGRCVWVSRFSFFSSVDGFYFVVRMCSSFDVHVCQWQRYLLVLIRQLNMFKCSPNWIRFASFAPANFQVSRRRKLMFSFHVDAILFDSWTSHCTQCKHHFEQAR